MKLRVLDLFSGIGGFSLGLERTGGFETVAFCEIEPFCQRVLRKHWPGVPIYGDIRELTAARLAADGIGVDVLSGGFPCQDASIAGSAWGTNTGTDGERTGLFREIIRLADALKPQYIIMENVAALRDRGMGDVLGALAGIGYCCEWRSIAACELGAAHRRDRVWFVAYTDSEHVARRGKEPILGVGRLQRFLHDGGITDFTGLSALPGTGLARRFNGVPDQVDRVRALGNAVVPQIPELIGRAILNTGVTIDHPHPREPRQSTVLRTDDVIGQDITTRAEEPRQHSLIVESAWSDGQFKTAK